MLNSALVIERNLECLINQKFSRIQSVSNEDETENIVSISEDESTLSTDQSHCVRRRKKMNIFLESKDKVDGSMHLTNLQSFPTGKSKYQPVEKLHGKSEETNYANSETSTRSDSERDITDTSNFYNDKGFLVQLNNIFENASNLDKDNLPQSKGDSPTAETDFLKEVKQIMN